jgi:hypothetical protein
MASVSTSKKAVLLHDVSGVPSLEASEAPDNTARSMLKIVSNCITFTVASVSKWEVDHLSIIAMDQDRVVVCIQDEREDSVDLIEVCISPWLYTRKDRRMSKVVSRKKRPNDVDPVVTDVGFLGVLVGCI